MERRDLYTLKGTCLFLFLLQCNVFPRRNNAFFLQKQKQNKLIVFRHAECWKVKRKRKKKKKKKKTADDGAKYSAFHFPKEKDLRSTWKVKVPKDGFKAIDNSVLCEKHFVPGDFVTESKDTIQLARKSKMIQRLNESD